MLLAAAVLPICAGGPLPAPLYPQDLVAHYTFEEGSGTVVKNHAGPASDGKILGPVSWAKSGGFSGLAFDGASTYVDCGLVPRMDETKGLTVLVWFNCTDPVGRRFIVNGYSGGNGWSMEAWGGHFRSITDRDSVMGNPVVADGQWHLAALTVDRDNAFKDYVDGEVVNSTHFSVDRRILNGGAGLLIGKYKQDDFFFGFKGLIAEVRIYNRVLSDQEIAGVYASVFPVPSANPAITEAKERLLDRLKLFRKLAPELAGVGELEQRVAAVDAAVRGKGRTAEQLNELARLDREADALHVEVAGRFYREKLGTSQAPMLWSVDSLTKVFADEYLPGGNGANVARADAMRGEREPVQVIVGSCEYRGTVSCRVEPLRHESGAVIDAIDLRRVTEQQASANTPIYFQVRKPLRAAPATFPDALEPNRTFELRPQSAQPVWVSIRVPAEAPAGLYRGSFVVTSTRGESRLPIELQVYDIALPEKPTGWFGTWNGVINKGRDFGFIQMDDEVHFEADDPRFWDLLNKALLSHREHRCNVFSDIPFWYMYNWVKVTRDADGSYRFDYTKWDRFVAMMDSVFGDNWRAIHAGLPLECKIHNPDGTLFRRRPPRAYWSPNEWGFQNEWNFSDSAFAAYAKIALRDLVGHLKENGWLDNVWFTYRDEPGEMEDVLKSAAVYQKLKELAPELTLDATQVSVTFFELMPALDVGILGWDSANRTLDPIVKAVGQGRKAMLYNNYSAMVDQPLLPFRVTAPVVFHTGMEGYGHWAWCWPNQKVDSDTYTKGFGPGEGYLVYMTDTPGEFIDSIRYEQLREVSEDYDLYKMAEAAGIDARSYALRQARSLTEFSDNPADYFQVRRELLKALEQANRAR